MSFTGQFFQESLDLARIATLCGDQQGESGGQGLALLPLDGGKEALYLAQGVVQEIGVAVAVIDESLDGVTPGISVPIRVLTRVTSGTTRRIKKSVLASKIASAR